MSKYSDNLIEEYIDLLEKLNVNLTNQVKYYKTQTSNKRKDNLGVIYVINQVGTDNYKIGISKNYRDRLNLFTVKMPFKIKEIAVYETEHFVEKEKELHEFFSDKRLNNSEFFELTKDDLDKIPDIIYKVTEEKNEESGEKSFVEPLLEKAKEVCLIEGKASTSFLQRKLFIGYARASRIMDMLEKEGFVDVADGAKPRNIIQK